MKLEEYQKLAARTMQHGFEFDLTQTEKDVLMWTFGLAGETGEFVDFVKKAIFHRHGLDIDKAIDELGDVIWYVDALCTVLEIDFEEVLGVNIEKLKKRYPDGFSTEDSIRRVDVHGDD